MKLMSIIILNTLIFLFFYIFKREFQEYLELKKAYEERHHDEI